MKNMDSDIVSRPRKKDIYDIRNDWKPRRVNKIQ
jgi:hypothetical protein